MRKVLTVAYAVFVSTDVLGMVYVRERNESFVQNQLAGILRASNKKQSESINSDEVTKPISQNFINKNKVPELIEKQKKFEQFLVEKHDGLINAIQINKTGEVPKIIRDVILKLHFTDINCSLKNPRPLSSEEIHKHSKIVKKNLDLFVNAANEEGNTPLFYAIDANNIDVVKLLIENGANINQHNNGGHTSLHWASVKGHKRIVKYLVKRGIDINILNDKKNTSVLIASELGHEDIVKFLVEHDANINLQDIDGDTPLLMAARTNHENIVKFLVEHGADINVKNKKGDSPLICAAKKRNLNLVRYLINKGADINAKNNEGDSPLMLLIKKKSSNNSPSRNLSPTEREVRQERHTEREINKFEIIKELLNHPNIDPNITDNEGNTTLYYAASRKKIKIIDVLLNHPKIKVDTKAESSLIELIKKINASDNTQSKNMLNFDSLLIRGVCQNNLEKVKLFVKWGADVNAGDEKGDTSLIHACYYNYEIAKFLVECGADINKKGYDGSSPLKTALEEKRSDIAELLLQHGASIEELTIFDATEANCIPLAEVFLKKDPNSVNLVDMMNENTPLHSACYNESFDVAKLLLKNSADIEKENIDEETPLSIINKKIQREKNSQIKAKAKEILQEMIYSRTLPAVADIFREDKLE